MGAWLFYVVQRFFFTGKKKLDDISNNFRRNRCTISYLLVSWNENREHGISSIYVRKPRQTTHNKIISLSKNNKTYASWGGHVWLISQQSIKKLLKYLTERTGVLHAISLRAVIRLRDKKVKGGALIKINVKLWANVTWVPSSSIKHDDLMSCARALSQYFQKTASNIYEGASTADIFNCTRFLHCLLYNRLC